MLYLSGLNDDTFDTKKAHSKKVESGAGQLPAPNVSKRQRAFKRMIQNLKLDLLLFII